MASILSTTSSVINVGCYALLNDDYVAAKVPNLRWVLASHSPSRAIIADVNQWVGCASLLPTVGVLPTTKFNHATAAQALKQQITTFGAIRTSATIKTSKVSYKVALKHAALCKTLTAAFATRGGYNSEHLTLDTVAGCESESHWLIDNNSNPMDALEAKDNTSFTLTSIYAKLTPQQVQVAELLSDGKTQSDVATILGVSPRLVSQQVFLMRARLS